MSTFLWDHSCACSCTQLISRKEKGSLPWCQRVVLCAAFTSHASNCSGFLKNQPAVIKKVVLER